MIKWGVLLVLLAYAVGMSVWAAARAGSRVCARIEVNVVNPSNTAPLTKKGVEEEIRKFDPAIVGKPAFSINTLRLEEHLRKVGNFESVECVITPLGTLRVDVVQMVPVLRVFDASGSYYINRDGKKMKSSHEFYNDVPIVYGNFNSKFTPRDVLPVVRYIQGDPVLRKLVVMLKADSPNDIMASTRISGHVINLGDTTRLDQKFNYLLTMYREVLPLKGWNTYDTISVKFKGQVVATRANKTPVEHSLPYAEETDPEEEALNEYANTPGSVVPTANGNVTPATKKDTLPKNNTNP